MKHFYRMWRLHFFALVFLSAAISFAAEPPLKLLTASFWGTAEDDDIKGAAQAPDGTIYLVGNTGAAAKDLPGAVVPSLEKLWPAYNHRGRGRELHLRRPGVRPHQRGQSRNKRRPARDETEGLRPS